MIWNGWQYNLPCASHCLVFVWTMFINRNVDCNTYNCKKMVSYKPVTDAFIDSLWIVTCILKKACRPCSFLYWLIIQLVIFSPNFFFHVWNTSVKTCSFLSNEKLAFCFLAVEYYFDNVCYISIRLFIIILM